MMSLEVIQQISDEAAERAASEGLVPYVLESPAEVERFLQRGRLPFPFLGSYVPEGWTETDESWFVDSSGFGRSDEPALTVELFCRELRAYADEHPTHGYAVVQHGEFQVYVGAYEPR
jgi:hypothetical protein